MVAIERRHEDRRLSLLASRLYLLYHELRTSPSDYSYVLQRREFEAHADLFLRVREHAPPALWPEITFDDGHISNFDLALPILAARRLQATFFITVGWTGTRAGYMGWSELKALHAAGQRIGAHGWTHTLLTHCDEAALRSELALARHTLEDKLGTAVTTMSLPGGRFNAHVLKACRDAGYQEIYSSIPRAETTMPSFVKGRLNIRSGIDVPWLESLLNPDSGLLVRLERQDRWKTVVKSAIGDRAYAKLWSVINRQEIDREPGETPLP